ncbi:glutathione S-transferase [Sulfitobacter alexandrii]|uniref:Glutathione S-transferase n=1 Tax=Sulfitobacter alexandrii TaxID=1917485 RepID=A0A1J0WKS1_9RHOB|nr:glutathione binding-like protein [Sulfitobacter alexandrii]APE44932.1 glutathione S-transferase [Sulfitobacter alexandrii]
MLTFYHGPHTRSSRIVRLLIEMDILEQVDVRVVGLVRRGGEGAPDPANPHPEGKVPLLVHDGEMIRESNAIILYLTDLFDSPLGVPVGDPLRGPYLSWLAYYGNVMEPVLFCSFAGIDHPAMQATFRGLDEMYARLAEALTDRPYLLGDRFSAADLLLVSAFTFAPQLVPDIPAIRNWVDRCGDRPSTAKLEHFESRLTGNSAAE